MKYRIIVCIALCALPFSGYAGNPPDDGRNRIKELRQEMAEVSAKLWPVKGWDITALSTASDAEYLDPLEKDIVLHLNMARTDPARYAREFIAPREAWFQGKRYLEPGGPEDFAGINTQEGVAAVREAVEALRDKAPLSPLQPSAGLSRAASDLARDQAKSGALGHGGSDQSDPQSRIERYGQWLNTLGENIAYGKLTGREVVVGLLVDDGVPGRGHRKNIFKPGFTTIGVACESHPRFDVVCVMDMTGGFRER